MLSSRSWTRLTATIQRLACWLSECVSGWLVKWTFFVVVCSVFSLTLKTRAQRRQVNKDKMEIHSCPHLFSPSIPRSRSLKQPAWWVNSPTSTYSSTMACAFVEMRVSLQYMHTFIKRNNHYYKCHILIMVTNEGIIVVTLEWAI